VNDELPFLDMILKRDRQTDKLIFSIYRKPTHTDKYLDFNSNNPTCHKRSVIKSLFDRADKICDESEKQKEETHLNNILKQNNYPQ
jgi:hypothetical protein